jgi:hypothetical protein
MVFTSENADDSKQTMCSMTAPCAKPPLLRRCRRLLAAVALLLLLASPSAWAGTFYVVDNNHDFGTVDLGTGVFTHIAFTGPIFDSLTVTPDGTLYGHAADLHLYTINPANGSTTQVGTATAPAPIWGLAAQSNATLLGFSEVFPPNYYSVPANGAAPTLLGNFGNGGAFGFLGTGTLAFGPGGTLYWNARLSGDAQSTFFSVNPANGNLTHIGTNLGSDVLSLVSDGTTLYGIDTNATDNPMIYTVDPVTGQATGIGHVTGLTAGVPENAVAFAPSPAPEPATLTLALVGLPLLGAAAGYRRLRGRRRAKGT